MGCRADARHCRSREVDEEHSQGWTHYAPAFAWAWHQAAIKLRGAHHRSTDAKAVIRPRTNKSHHNAQGHESAAPAAEFACYGPCPCYRRATARAVLPRSFVSSALGT